MTNLLEVFSSGGGTQSTAIAALIIQGRLPRPDYRMFFMKILELTAAILTYVVTW